MPAEGISVHAVDPVAVPAPAVRNTQPPLVPARTTWSTLRSSTAPAFGATAMALTEPQPSTLLAADQLVAPFFVRHMRLPPVHSVWESFGDIVNGVMNRNPVLLIPLTAFPKPAPPFVDFTMDNPVISA